MSTHVVIQSVPPRIRYISNGTLATYTFPFAIFKNSDLKVYFGSTLQDATTYSVSGVGQSSGGSVTLSNVPASGTIITLTRELAIERTTDFQEGGALRADTLNNELDYQIACQQQIADNLNRSMVLPPYAADTNVNLTLPLPSAGKAIVWNAAGTNLENSTVSVNAMESTLNGYKTAAETAATTATTQANEATSQAQTATAQAAEAAEQAGIATQKAQEASSLLSSKLDTGLDNLSTLGKQKIIEQLMPDYTSTVNQITHGTVFYADKDYLASAALGESVYVGNASLSSDMSNPILIFNLKHTGSSVSRTPYDIKLVKGLYYQATCDLYYLPVKGENS